MANIKDLPARSWAQLREEWVEHIPAQLEVQPPEVGVEELLKLAGAKLEDKAVIANTPQLRETVFLLAVFLRRKAAYCVRCAIDMNKQGFPTGANILMYDACFFGAKSICYLLGVAEAGRDSSFYLDIFYKEARRRILVDVGHQAFRLKQRMSHEMLWEIFQRLMNTFKADDDELSDKIRQMRRNDLDKFTRERNRLMYAPPSWSRQDEVEQSDFMYPVSYAQNLVFFASPQSGVSEYFQPYNHGALALLYFADHLFDDIAHAVESVADVMRGIERAPVVESFEFN